jgi:hypothetical protein
MKKENYSLNILANTTAREAFKSINHISAWWTKNVEGQSKKLHDIFTVHFGETFITLKIVEFVPYKKILWHVVDCHKHWLKNKQEWKDTMISWEISEKKNPTEIKFTHIGLVPGLECYNGCENAWNGYLNGSLFNLLTKEKGVPELK